MTEKKEKTLLDEVLGDGGVFTDPDPLHAMDPTMPVWMTENLLDPKPVKKAESIVVVKPAEMSSGPV